MSLIHAFTSQLWLLGIATIAGITGHTLWTQRKTMPLQQKLFGYLSIAIVLHVIEEWVWPAGLHYIHNMQFHSPAPDRYPMNELSDTITNSAAIVMAAIVMVKWSHKMWLHVTSLLFCLMEAVLHTQLGFLGIHLFHNQGLHVPYSPGSATALLLFVPIAIGNIITLTRNNGFTVKNIAIGLGILLATLVAIIVIPEGGLKNLHTTFGFPNNGFYDQFLRKK